jgi:hypothetical protein
MTTHTTERPHRPRPPIATISILSPTLYLYPPCVVCERKHPKTKTQTHTNKATRDEARNRTTDNGEHAHPTHARHARDKDRPPRPLPRHTPNPPAPAAPTPPPPQQRTGASTYTTQGGRAATHRYGSRAHTARWLTPTPSAHSCAGADRALRRSLRTCPQLPHSQPSRRRSRTSCLLRSLPRLSREAAQDNWLKMIGSGRLAQDDRLRTIGSGRSAQARPLSRAETRELVSSLVFGRRSGGA